MPAGFSSSDQTELIQAERDVQARIGGLDIDFASLAAVSNIFRAATTVRNHMERTVLTRTDLSFTAFTVLWVLWIWGEQEARHVADESGISRGTLTGVITTLEARGLVQRRPHPDDKRSVLMSASPAGEALMVDVFPRSTPRRARSPPSCRPSSDSRSPMPCAPCCAPSKPSTTDHPTATGGAFGPGCSCTPSVPSMA
jgi:MarR family transcriptional regulator, organic hydroperoxide resistance regulator